MNQSRLTSLRESISNTTLGFVLSLACQFIFLVLILGLPMSWQQNLSFAIFMTFVSIARGYVVRRWFEAKRESFPIPPFTHAVLAERHRQVSHEGYSPAHDDEHSAGELARAGAAYAMAAGNGSLAGVVDLRVWPWKEDPRKPYGFRRDLVKGAALILAEGERFDRKKKRRETHGAWDHPRPPKPMRGTASEPIVSEGSVSQPRALSPDSNQNKPLVSSSHDVKGEG